MQNELAVYHAGQPRFLFLTCVQLKHPQGNHKREQELQMDSC